MAVLRLAAAPGLRIPPPRFTSRISPTGQMPTTATSRSPPRRSVGTGGSAEDVVVALRAYVALLELLGVREGEIPRVAVARRRLAGRTAQLLVLAPAAAYGLVINGLPMAGLRTISITGVAPATAASLKPAFALIAFPAVGRRSDGGATGGRGSRELLGWRPVARRGLAATVTVAENAQLSFLLARAVRRAEGPVLERLTNARRQLVETVRACCAGIRLRNCSIACWIWA